MLVKGEGVPLSAALEGVEVDTGRFGELMSPPASQSWLGPNQTWASRYLTRLPAFLAANLSRVPSFSAKRLLTIEGARAENL